SAPYDVISPAAQAEYYARDPYNVIRLELGHQYPTDTPTDNRYTRAATTYDDFRRIGALRADDGPGLYVYDETFDNEGHRLTRRSVLAAVRLANWDEGVVFPHEYTLPRAKEDRLRLLTATRTQFSPLLVTYDDPGKVVEALTTATDGAPLVEFELTPGTVAAAASAHRLWRLTDLQSIQTILSALRNQPLYIADGHHRYETALEFRDRRRAEGASQISPSEYVMMALVATTDPGLVVLPTHRIVRGLGHVDLERALSALEAIFLVERQEHVVDVPTSSLVTARATSPSDRPAGPSIVALGLQPGYFTRLTLRPDLDLGQLLPDDPPVLWNLDTLILQRLVFEHVFGLSRREAEAGDRIQYTRDQREALEAFSSGDAQFVFFLTSTPMVRIREATRAGVRMPQKTTYFYPKPVTGLVFFDHSVAW
ncbi:MAG TPA: DUF1015 domain-containing protein, partial [Chloroflexota bacterium]|nr:DUF1015 domain-containing protein [Chloroflexota bacterium]